MQLHLRGLRVAARQLHLQATVFSFHNGHSRIPLRPGLYQLHLHLLQRFSQHARLLHPLKGGSLPSLLRHVPLRRHSRAAGRPPALKRMLLLLPLLLRAPLPRLLFDVCRWPRMLHACELVLVVVAMGGGCRLLWAGLRDRVGG